MTQSEEKTINKLNETLDQIKQENAEFKQQIQSLVEELNSKIEQKHLPITLEQQITDKIKDSIGSSIISALGSYDSPLKGLSVQVIKKYSNRIEEIFGEIIRKEIETQEFKKDLQNQFRAKLAKSVMSGTESIIDKEFNNLKQNPIFRSELTLVINQLIKDFNLNN